MGKTLLVGDSGGTSTDWCLVTDGERKYFSTESYHPAHFSEAFFEKMKSFWGNMQLDRETEIHFYGAGCSTLYNQQQVISHFKSMGFETVFAESDLLGACRGLLGNTAGFVGIMGTGSVVAEYDGETIRKIHGGFGYLIGDEGSGYAFGRKLVHKYLNGQLSDALTLELLAEWGDRSAVLKQVYGPEGKQWIGKLASTRIFSDEIEALHRENIAEFVALYLAGLNVASKTICLSGSYAFYHSQIARSVLEENGWALSGCVQKPIESITDYTIKATL